MSSKQKMTADLLFGVQMVSLFIIFGVQFFRLIETTEGQLITMFVAFEGFCLLSFMLAEKAHKINPSRVTLQVMWIYGVAALLLASNIVAIFINDAYKWSGNDTKTTSIVLVGTVLLLVIAKLKEIDFSNPMLKGMFAIICKALPQVTLAIEVAQSGGAGIPLTTIIVAHITTLIRIGQIYFSIREAGWDKNRKWLFVSEFSNWLTHCGVTVVWLIWLVSL